MNNLFLTPVVRTLIILNVAVFLVTFFMPETLIHLAVFYPESPYFKPYQIVSHMFAHAGIMHIFFNMFALSMFGPPLEMRWGAERFLFFYLFCGLFACGAHLTSMYFTIETPMDLNTPAVGASGAIMGVLAGFGLSFPNVELMMLFPPIRMKAIYYVILWAVIETTMGATNTWGSVAHFAHLGGLAGGALVWLFYRYRLRL